MYVVQISNLSDNLSTLSQPKPQIITKRENYDLGLEVNLTNLYEIRIKVLECVSNTNFTSLRLLVSLQITQNLET